MSSPYHLRVVLGPRVPFVFNHNNSSEGEASYTGLLIELFQKILYEIQYHNTNITFAYEYRMLENTGGGTLTNGSSWTGITGELFYDRADVALFPLTRTAPRLEVIDCTYSYLDQGLTLLVPATVEAPGPLSVLAPFTVTLWVILLCTIVAVALLFWALDAYGRWIRKRQIRVLQASGLMPATKASSRGGKKEKRSHVMTSFMAAAGAPERPERISWGGQVLYIVYCFFCLIVLSSYTANLTSFLAVRRANDGITGLQDVIKVGGRVAVNEGGSTHDYFVRSQDSLAMQLRGNLALCASVEECVAWVRSGEVTAYVADNSVLEYQAGLRPCDTAVVGDPFGPGNLVIGLQKGSWLTPLFNAALQQFNEDGTLTELQRNWFDDRSQCEDVNGQLGNSRLSAVQMLGAFVFLAMGVLVAFTTGTIENLKWCLLADSCCGCGGGDSCGSAADHDMARGRSTTDPCGVEPSQRAPPSVIRGGRFGRISMALLGIRKSGRSAGGESDSSSFVRACPHCGGCINSPKGGVGSVATGAGGGVVSMYGAVGGGAAVGSPFSSVFGSGAAAAGADVGQAVLPINPNGSNIVLDAGGIDADGGGAAVAAAVMTATDRAPVAAKGANEIAADAVGARGPAGPLDVNPVSPLHGLSYGARPASDQTASGVQMVAGSAAFWGSGEHERTTEATASLSVVWGTPPPAVSPPPPRSPPPAGPPLASSLTAAANAGSLSTGGQRPPSSPLPPAASTSAPAQLSLPPPLLPPLPPYPFYEQPATPLQSPLLSGHWESGGPAAAALAARQPQPLAPVPQPSKGELQPRRSPAALGMAAPAAATAATAAATATPASAAPGIPVPERAPSMNKLAHGGVDDGGGRGGNVSQQRSGAAGPVRRRMADATQPMPSYTRSEDDTARAARAETAAEPPSSSLEARGSGAAAATAMAAATPAEAVGPVAARPQPQGTGSGLGEEGALVRAALSLRFRNKWSDACRPPPATGPLSAGAAAVEPCPSEPHLPSP